MSAAMHFRAWHWRNPVGASQNRARPVYNNSSSASSRNEKAFLCSLLCLWCSSCPSQVLCPRWLGWKGGSGAKGLTLHQVVHAASRYLGKVGRDVVTSGHTDLPVFQVLRLVCVRLLSRVPACHLTQTLILCSLPSHCVVHHIDVSVLHVAVCRHCNQTSHIPNLLPTMPHPRVSSTKVLCTLPQESEGARVREEGQPPGENVRCGTCDWLPDEVPFLH